MALWFKVISPALFFIWNSTKTLHSGLNCGLDSGLNNGLDIWDLNLIARGSEVMPNYSAANFWHYLMLWAHHLCTAEITIEKIGTNVYLFWGNNLAQPMYFLKATVRQYQASESTIVSWKYNPHFAHYFPFHYWVQSPVHGLVLSLKSRFHTTPFICI